MQVSAHISFTGQCEAAFRFYEQNLGGQVTFMLPWEGSPMAGQAPPEWGKKMLHATLVIGGATLTGYDGPPGTEPPPHGVTFTLNTTDKAEAARVFSALSENGKVTMPLQETFWAELYGHVTDQFGIPWAVNCGKPQ
jgi:PhnB protein